MHLKDTPILSSLNVIPNHNAFQAVHGSPLAVASFSGPTIGVCHDAAYGRSSGRLRNHQFRLFIVPPTSLRSFASVGTRSKYL